MNKFLPKQPWSTLTSLFYAAVGFLAIQLSLPTAIALFLLSLGSIVYHWTNSDTGRHLDEAGMIAVGLIFAVPHQWILVLLFTIVILIDLIVNPAYLKRLGQNENLHIYSLLAGTYITMSLLRVHYEPYGSMIGLLLLLVALYIRYISLSKKDSLKEDEVHSLWHFITACAFLLFLIGV